MRAPPRWSMAVGALRLAGMVRRVAGAALAVPLQRDRRSMAVLAAQARAGRDVDIVPKRDLADRVHFCHLEGEGQADRPLSRDGVTRVAL